MLSYIKTDDHLTVCIDNKEPYTVYVSEDHFTELEAAVQQKDVKKIEQLIDRSYQFQQMMKQKMNNPDIIEKLTIKNGLVYVDGVPMETPLTNRMIELVNDGYDIEPFKLFLLNLLKNPSYQSITELYQFLEKSDLPITEDGHFLAYKNVRSDFTDIYTGKYDNSVGAYVEQPRNQVDDNRYNTCSNGLHFCSINYLSHYMAKENGHTVVVKINPKDVVSIPVDYNNAKGRCCAYTVIRELNKGEILKSTLESTAEPTKDDNLFDKPTIIQQIDSNGMVVAEFSNVHMASAVTGIDASNIRKVLRKQRITAGNYYWVETH